MLNNLKKALWRSLGQSLSAWGNALLKKSEMRPESGSSPESTPVEWSGPGKPTFKGVDISEGGPVRLPVGRSGGPPAHWLERVRRDAPQLLKPEERIEFDAGPSVIYDHTQTGAGTESRSESSDSQFEEISERSVFPQDYNLTSLDHEPPNSKHLAANTVSEQQTVSSQEIGSRAGKTESKEETSQHTRMTAPSLQSEYDPIVRGASDRVDLSDVEAKRIRQVEMATFEHVSQVAPASSVSAERPKKNEDSGLPQQDETPDTGIHGWMEVGPIVHEEVSKDGGNSGPRQFVSRDDTPPQERISRRQPQRLVPGDEKDFPPLPAVTSSAAAMTNKPVFYSGDDFVKRDKRNTAEKNSSMQSDFRPALPERSEPELNEWSVKSPNNWPALPDEVEALTLTNDANTDRWPCLSSPRRAGELHERELDTAGSLALRQDTERLKRLEREQKGLSWNG